MFDSEINNKDIEGMGIEELKKIWEDCSNELSYYTGIELTFGKLRDDEALERKKISDLYLKVDEILSKKGVAM